MKRPATVSCVLLAAVVLAACSGPGTPLDVAVKEVPSDIVLGSPASGAAAPAPVPPSLPVLAGPGVPPAVAGGPASGDDLPGGTTTSVAPPACPRADPLAAPRREAFNRITTPPRPGTLPYRVDGTFSVSGATAREGRFPATSTRTVTDVVSNGRGFTYEVEARLAGTTTTTGYQVVTDETIPGDAGIYVTHVTTTAPSGASARFQPPLPMKLVELPLVAGATVTAAGTDPVSATAVTWTTTVGPKRRVDACGTPLDAFTVRLTNGQARSPAMDVTFTAEYAIATQFGGLSIADDISAQGREGDDDVARRIASTVSADPEQVG